MGSKAALVTGASRGIGRSIALALAEAGYDIGVGFRSCESGAREVCGLVQQQGRSALALRADIADIAQIDGMFERFFDRFGGIEVLVNNAGVTRGAPLLEVTPELWSEITNADWRGSFFCTQRAARRMVADGTRGSIINITSIHDRSNFPVASVYGPAKAALAKFTQHAALELAKHGIRVNAVEPGCIAIREGQEQTPRGRMLRSRIPFGRYGTTREVADLVVYLASDKAGYITGASFLLDGGALLPTLLDNEYVDGGGDTAAHWAVSEVTG